MELVRSADPARVESALLSRVLAPYRPNCRYLRAATVHGRDGLAWAEGEFAIPESCYIDDTGHFNSVEFNLCYNQLVYVLMAQCVVSRYVPALNSMSLDDYLRRQLPDVLIHEFRSVFRKPLDPRAFRGTVAIERAVDKRRFAVLETVVAFEDGRGGHAQGRVDLAIVDRAGDERAAAGS
ncbi:MAG: hypothetical protein FJ299_09260 [Planctomycetes bacterium]|nr:hypothetical protein [Planctomycetota bacterium]